MAASKRSVSRAHQAAGSDASREALVPEGLTGMAWQQQFEAVLSRVAGACHKRLADPWECQLAVFRSVVGLPGRCR